MSVRAPAEKNFRRANVKPSKRRNGRGRLPWKAIRVIVVGALVLYGGYRAVNLVTTASMLQVRRIAVRGNVRLSAGEVQSLVDGLRGSSILTVNLPSYRRRLMESPWVEEVALRRVLPSTVEVFVSERRPIGLCRLGARMYLVDRHGTVIDELGPQYAEFDLPVIDGLVGAPSSGGPAIDASRAELAARLIEAVAPRAELARRMSQIDVSDPHDAVVLLERDSALLHVGDERFLERLQAYVDLAPALVDRVKDIDYVDLRFDGRVYVRPGGNRSRRADPAGGRPRPAKQF